MQLDEIICKMMGATEDFLWTRQVDLHNTEPRKQDEDDDVVIYGHDFATLYDDFLDVYCKFCDATQSGSKDAYYTMIEDLIEAVEHFLSVRKVDLRNKEKRADNEQDDVIYGTDYTELYSEFYEVTSTELFGY